jgi:hypothetical protein
MRQEMINGHRVIRLESQEEEDEWFGKWAARTHSSIKGFRNRKNPMKTRKVDDALDAAMKAIEDMLGVKL